MSQYNLRRKNSKNISLPVQISLSDSAIMSQVLGASQPTPGQRSRQDQTSESEYESNTSLHGSDVGGDMDENPDHEDDQDNQPGPSTFDQTIINQKILEQLSRIGSRLDKLENEKTCKKSSDKAKIKKQNHNFSKIPIKKYNKSTTATCPGSK